MHFLEKQTNKKTKNTRTLFKYIIHRSTVKSSFFKERFEWPLVVVMGKLFSYGTLIKFQLSQMLELGKGVKENGHYIVCLFQFFLLTRTHLDLPCQPIFAYH